MAFESRDIAAKAMAIAIVTIIMALLFWFVGWLWSSRINKLTQELKDKDTNVRCSAVISLGEIKDYRVVEPLIAALKDKDSDVRDDAAKALGKIAQGKIKDARAVVPLIAALKDKDPDVRDDSAKTLGKIMAQQNSPGWMKDARAVEPLIAALKDKDAIVREVVANALGEINDDRSVEPLIATLTDEDSGVRNNAASALGGMGDKRAIEPLIGNLTDWASNINVAEALSELGWKSQSDADMIHLLVAQRKGEELKQKWDLARSVLLKDVESGDPRAISNALYAFIGIGKEEIIPELIEKLNTKGNKDMAEAYINCGNNEVKKAGEEWASNHGYTISSGVNGNAPIGWGEF